MKEYFSYSVKSPKDTEDLPRYIPDFAFIFVKTEDEKPPSDIITLSQNSYLLFEKLPSAENEEEQNIIVGYHCATKKHGKTKKLSRYANAVLYNGNDYYELQKKTDEKIIGYLKVMGKNQYVAVTRKRKFLPLLWLLLLLLIFMLFPPIPPPIFVPNEVTSGAITPIEIGELDPDYFNIKINATPILEDGKLNIRIENSLRNVYSCHVEVFLAEKIIYTSPLISPNQSLEFATIDGKYPTGTYDGVAVFHYLDGEKELEVTSSVKLKIDVRK